MKKAWAALFVLALVWIAAMLHRGQPLGWDELEFFRATKWIGDGQVVFRDFWEHHTPLQWLVFAPVARLFASGPGAASIVAMRWAQFALWIAILFLAMRLTRGPARWWALVLLLCAPLFVKSAVEYRVDVLGNLGFIGALVAAMRKRWIAFGALMSVAVLANMRLAPLVIFTAIVMLAWNDDRWRFNPRALRMLLGVVAAAIPFIGWLMLAGPPALDPGIDGDLTLIVPTPKPDTTDVECTVFAPARCQPEVPFLVQVFTHGLADNSIVRALAAEFDAQTSRRGTTTLDEPITRGTTLTFALAINGAVIDEPTQRLIWRGRPAAVQFGVTVPRQTIGPTLVGTVYVARDSVPIGHVKFTVAVTQLLSEAEDASIAHRKFQRYRHAFISYASPDRSEVLKRVQMLSRTNISFFQDLLSLDPGEHWEHTLYREIDASDVFYLFWSTHAKNSIWVMKEVQYALARQAGDVSAPPEIVPVIIEGPPPVTPPAELAHLHFNDRVLYFLAGTAGASAP